MCIQKYKAGKPINDPGGCKHKTFHNTVRRWVRVYDLLGEVGLAHKKPKRNWQDKMNMIKRIMEGESISGVAISNGIQADIVSKWYKIYQRSGIEGLKLDRRGRTLKMQKKPKISNTKKTKEELEQELVYLRAENEYLKKLNALVQKREGRQPKKK